MREKEQSWLINLGPGTTSRSDGITTRQRENQPMTSQVDALSTGSRRSLVTWLVWKLYIIQYIRVYSILQNWRYDLLAKFSSLYFCLGTVGVGVLIVLLWMYSMYRMWVVWAYTLNFDQVTKKVKGSDAEQFKRWIDRNVSDLWLLRLTHIRSDSHYGALCSNVCSVWTWR